MPLRTTSHDNAAIWRDESAPSITSTPGRAARTDDPSPVVPTMGTSNFLT